MRIALVTPEYITEHTFDGGLANYTHRLALSLRDMHHEPVVFIPHDGDQVIDHERIPVHRVQTWNPKRQWKKFYTYIDLFNDRTNYRFNMATNLWWRSRRLNAAVRAEHAVRPFDVIHYAHLGGLGLLRPRGIPSVVRLSSSTKLCQQHGGYGEETAEMRQQIWVESMALRKADRIFGPSKKIIEMMQTEIKRPISLIETPFIANTGALNDDLFLTHAAGKKYLLFFGSVCLIKGVGTIAEIIKPLLKFHPDLHFIFIGKKVPGQRGGCPMERVITAAGKYADRIVWLPAQRHDRLFPFIQNAHAVILPSLTDNFPNACIEAMAFGRVVVGTRGNGFEQMIRDGVSGFLCDPGDAKDLQRTVDKALALSPEARAAMGAAAAERIAQLTPENVVAQVLDEYLAAADLYR